MAFSAEELRVLRRALALALHPSPVRSPAPGSAHVPSPTRDEDVRDFLRLAQSVDEAVQEGARLRAFLVADLARYRAALPGTAAGYLALLDDVLGAGYQPGPDDLAALRALRGNPAAAALLDRCRTLAERSVRARLAGHAVPAPERPRMPAPRTHLLALPGGLGAAEKETSRPVPTPAEVFPPKRPTPAAPAPAPASPTPSAPPEPAPPAPTPADPSHQLAAG
ncbi:hypothetical protein DMA15_20725 [Streptomyces sp. WAC 01529]|nr:hypothetical protein DMA15_20725 [Streptomyces sp. WAC 01529]